ncbi:MAG: serine/threonine-protein kinase [Vicinamibacterales bacterium]
MTRAQWERVRQLFERAVDDPPTDIGAWLSAEAGDDRDVRAEVASLLDHHTRAGHFISKPISDEIPGLLDETPRFAPGQVLGSYSILREAGRGGMGRVYVATDLRLNRTVAIKVLPPELTDSAEGRERLRREARAAAALTHPGICTVHSLEELDGELVIVTEFVDGRTLREEMAAGRLPLPKLVLETARELASALAAAHARGITHRDLKPENVMRTRDGRLKILDFGLARADGPATDPLAVRVTADAVAIGTPAYMAPEQLNGQQGDARSDVFALGVLIYEYASGVHPFDAPTPLALMSRVMAADPEPLERRVRDLPPVIAGVVARALEKAPQNRFPSAAAVLAALNDLAAAEQRAVVPEAARVAAVQWWRTHQVVVIALYFLAASVTWQIKEWQPGAGIALALFIGVGIASAIGGVLRGHLLFTERVNRSGLAVERGRTSLFTLAVDLLLGLALLGAGLLVAPSRPVVAVLTIGLAVGLALTRLVVERATTDAAFPASPHVR